MKLVFLGIDGVLNSQAWLDQAAQRRVRVRPSDQLDPSACARVQRLCDETGAKIVVSSTWAHVYSRRHIELMFQAKGLTAPIIGRTPRFVHLWKRGDIIQGWFFRYPMAQLEGVVILNNNDEDMTHLTPWLVQSSLDTGFTDAHVLAAKRVLAQAMPPRRAA